MAAGIVYQWEEHEPNLVQKDTTLVETKKQAIVFARRGQGLFKKRVMTLEHVCRITGMDRESTCKPAIANLGVSHASH